MKNLEEISNDYNRALRNVDKVLLEGILERAIELMKEEPKITDFLMGMGGVSFEYEDDTYMLNYYSQEDHYNKHRLIGEIYELIKDTSIDVSYLIRINNKGETNFPELNSTEEPMFEKLTLEEILEKLA